MKKNALFLALVFSICTMHQVYSMESDSESSTDVTPNIELLAKQHLQNVNIYLSLKEKMETLEAQNNQIIEEEWKSKIEQSLNESFATLQNLSRKTNMPSDKLKQFKKTIQEIESEIKNKKNIIEKQKGSSW